MKLRRYIPIKLKFLAVILFILLSSMAIFLKLSYQTFFDDKKLFVMELNMAQMTAAVSDIRLELKSRLESLQVVVPRVYNPLMNEKGELIDPLTGLADGLPDELLGITVYRQNQQNVLEIVKQYRNHRLIAKNAYPDNLLTLLQERKPAALSQITDPKVAEILNRSITYNTNKEGNELPVITFVLSGTFVNDSSKQTLIIADFLPNFLKRKLTKSELSELFLIYKNGSILIHPNQRVTVQHASRPYAHPIVPRLATSLLPKESVELEVNDEPYLVSIGETGFKDIFVVAQIKKKIAFQAVTALLQKSLWIALAILFAATAVSIIFAGQLTRNIARLKKAAEQIGIGQLRLKLRIRSNDELQQVGESFQWMANRLKQLLQETAEKARLESELKTAQVVQNTLLTKPEIASNAVEFDSYYISASECGGDVWDASLEGNKLTVLIGDATGHGAPAAIVTAVAKSCFSTMSAIYHETSLPPEQLMTLLNDIVYRSCRGQLLMTMCIIQIDLETGELYLCNAGHEAPMSIPTPKKVEGEKEKVKANLLFSRGERLGFAPDQVYESVRYQIQLGETILLYTDGVTEARDKEKKEYGERSLKKILQKNGGKPLPEIKEAILTSLHEHVGDAKQEDDISFVLLKWVRNSVVRKPTDLIQDEAA